MPVLSPTFGILDWSKDELNNIDVKTRKILTGTGSFHRNGDIDRLYCYRKEGGRGLNGATDIYISRIISLSLHLIESSNTNKYLDLVRCYEKDTIMRQSEEFQREFENDYSENTPKQDSLMAK